MINEIQNIDNIEINKRIRKSESQLLKKIAIIRDELMNYKVKSSAVAENDPSLPALKHKINTLRDEYLELVQELSSLRANNKRKEQKIHKLKKLDREAIKANSKQFSYNDSLVKIKKINYSAPKIIDTMVY